MSVLDLFRLDGRVAVVTGGARGIGARYVDALLETGAKVVVADVDETSVTATVDRHRPDAPDRIVGAVIDVTDRSTLRAMVGVVEHLWGRIDIVVNNAGLFSALEPRPDPWDIPDEEFDRVMAVNVRGVYAVTET